MSPTLRVLWMLVRWPGLLLSLLLAMHLFAAGVSRERRLFLLAFVDMVVIAGWLFARYRDFAASNVWRWLPDGQRILTRVLAIIVLLGMSVVAAFACWAQARGVVHLPIRNVPLAFAALAVVVFLVFAQRVPAIQPRVARAFIVTLTLLFVEAIFREPSQGLSWVTAVSVGTLWLFVVATAGVPSSEGWVARVRDVVQRFELRASRLGFARQAPARLLLQADQPLKAALPVAFIGTLAASLLLRDMLANHARDTLFALLGGGAGFISVAMLFMSMAAARRARLLWLHFGDSRSQVLRVCERALLVNLLVITLVVWLVVAAVAVGFASSRMWPGLLAALPAMLAGALPALYLGLAWRTFADNWRDMPTGHIILAAFFLLPVVWRAAHVVVQSMELKPDPLFIAFAVLAALLLRGFAVWRWRKIDWSHLKTVTT